MNKNIIMPLNAYQIRQLARKALVGRWKAAVIATLLYMLAVSAPTTILQLIFKNNPLLSSTMSLVYLLITAGAFTLGYSYFILENFRRKNPSPGEIFHGFSKLGRALGISIAVGFIIWLLLLPGAFLIVFGITYGGAAAFICSFLGIALMALPIRVALSYSQVFFVALDHEEIPVMGVLGHSKYLMEGNKFKYFCVQLSFIGWAILCALPTGILDVMIETSVMEVPLFTQTIMFAIAGIGMLWLNPYTSTASAGFYEIISGRVLIKQITEGDLGMSTEPEKKLEETPKLAEESQPEENNLTKE